jgi:hypothetical protein
MVSMPRRFRDASHAARTWARLPSKEGPPGLGEVQREGHGARGGLGDALLRASCSQTIRDGAVAGFTGGRARRDACG